ncbi:P-type conjugative transfer protein TrbJ (plasmid) [Paraburkholderia sprentiae WSM5005]|uniref:P-type conjugative transfer protein TrbJ n=1 Tax=Paraburkholderia sprentiae WSM5005 TaxID=754502 RepID=A0ACA8AWY1_9BURK|nr:P-type conjugative transfer protein TrbJ [Paraburkholderia sprentiae]APA90222.1 P-type conjugative transfer protein TrbJ [Paraburkholderia sprentiae WSM5005]
MNVIGQTLISGALLACVACNAHAGAVAGATEPTQILNNIQLTASYAQQAQQTVTQINQYETMLRNLMNSTPSELLGQAAGALWNDNNMTQTFKNLSTIVEGGQKIAYTLQNTDQLFHNLHPGYGSAFDFQNGYRNWSDNTLNSVQNALSLMNAHASNFANEQTMIKELQTRSQSAVGQLQVLQSGNEIGVAMIGQMQELRQLQAAQIQQQGAYIASQQSAADTKHTGAERVFGNVKSDSVLPLNTAPVQ